MNFEENPLTIPTSFEESPPAVQSAANHKTHDKQTHNTPVRV